MRMTLVLSAVGLALLLSSPASAQTCGAGMCGMMAQKQAQTSTPIPNATPGQSSPEKAGMCECCKNMGMMKGGMDGHKDMPGMQK